MVQVENLVESLLQLWPIDIRNLLQYLIVYKLFDKKSATSGGFKNETMPNQ